MRPYKAPRPAFPVREWRRYEGRPLRDLYRELRERFVLRHLPERGVVLDVGSGPGRFYLPAPGRRWIFLDRSRAMLQAAEAHRPPGGEGLDAVQGDARRLPFLPGVAAGVLLLGNVIGASGARGDRVWSEAVRVLSPSGRLILEVSAGAGTAARYLERLPLALRARAFASPSTRLVERIRAEGYQTLRPRKRAGTADFRRHDAAEVTDRLARLGLRIRERRAIAPATGGSPELAEAVAALGPGPFQRLVDVEDRLGADPGSWSGAAAVLVAAERGGAR